MCGFAVTRTPQPYLFILSTSSEHADAIEGTAGVSSSAASSSAALVAYPLLSGPRGQKARLGGPYRMPAASEGYPDATGRAGPRVILSIRTRPAAVASPASAVALPASAVPSPAAAPSPAAVPSPAEERAEESREAAEAETASAEESSPDATPREEPTAAAATAAAATAAVITAAAAAAAAATAAAATAPATTAPAALADAITAATAVPQETSLEAQLSVATAYEAPALALLTNQPLTHTHVASHHATPTLASPFYRAPPMAAGSGGGARASSVVSAAPAVPPAVPPAQGGGNFLSFSRGFDWLTKEISEIAREFGAEAPPPIEVLRPIFFAPAPTAAVLPIAPHASTSAATGATTGALSSSESNEKDREALLGRTASKSRGKGAQGGSVEERAIGGASATTAEMHEMVHAAHQRGEQLSDLGDKSQQLADNADDFLQMAKQLRKQEEKGLFGALFG